MSVTDFTKLDDVQIVTLHGLCEQELFRRTAKRRIQEWTTHYLTDKYGSPTVLPTEEVKRDLDQAVQRNFETIMTGTAQECAQTIGDFAHSFLRIANLIGKEYGAVIMPIEQTQEGAPSVDPN